MTEGTVDASAPPGEVRLTGNGHRPVSEFLAPYDIRLHTDWARRRKTRQLIRRISRVCSLLLVDGLGLVLGYLSAVFLRQQILPSLFAGLLPVDLWLSLELLPAALGVQFLTLAAFGVYGPGKGRRDYYRVFTAILVGTLVLFFGSTLYARISSQLLFALAGMMAVSWVVSLRWLLDKGLNVYRSKRSLGRSALIVGRPDQIPRVRTHLVKTSEINKSNIRFVESMPFSEVDAPAERNHGMDRLTEQLLRREIEVVVVTGDPPNGMAKRLLDRCLRAGCQVMLVPSVLQEIPNPVKAEDLSGLFSLTVMRPRLALPELALKRAFDFTVSLVGMVLLAPVFAALALGVKLDSPGSVFFRQRRVGVGGRIFHMYKFRTMVADADTRKHEIEHLNQYGDSRFFKIRNDPRITRVGRLMRRTSLDELPQLLNVLRGDMSLVGPRPPVPEEVAEYSEYHLQRLSVTPGITGLWQINGRSDVLDFEEVVRLDLEYINTWSLWKDLTILLRTLPAIFRLRHAA